MESKILMLILFLHCYYQGITASFFQDNPHRLMKNEDVCLGETFRTKCSSQEVAVIDNATYGRMKLGRCVQVDMGFLGCKQDATFLAQQLCSGKQQCAITLPDDAMELLRPCLELKSYLSISYYCLKVLSASEYSCSQSQFIKTTIEKGYISSERNECGNNNIWLVEAKPGQRINLTLINFGADEISHHDSSQGGLGNWRESAVDVCNKFADIRDSATGKEESLCGGKHKESHIMLSLGNSVEIEIPNSRRQFEHEFLIKFEVIGCPDPALGKNTWSTRDGNKITIGCKTSDIVYEMICIETLWIGTYENCSADDTVIAARHQKDKFMFSSLPRGLVIAAIIAIAVVVGTIIVVVGIIVFKRKREHDYVDAAYTIPQSEKVYISPDNRQRAMTNPSVTWTEHTNKGSALSRDDKYTDCPIVSNVRSDMNTRSHVQHDYQCAETPVNVQVAVDKRGYAHVWERPLPAPESQHSY